MTKRPSMTSEKVIAAAIVAILRKTPKRRATIAELVELLPRRLRLTKADLEYSPSRPKERRWEQRIRNIRSHQTGREYGLRTMDNGFRLEPKPRAEVLKYVAAIRREALDAAK